MVPDPEALEVGSAPQRTAGTTVDLLGTGIQSRGSQGVIEHRAGDGARPPRVGEAVETWEQNPSAGRTHHHHVADVEAGRLGHSQVVEDLESPGPDKVPAGLVPRKPGLVDQRHARTGPGQNQSSDTAGGAGADHQDVVPARPHVSPLGR